MIWIMFTTPIILGVIQTVLMIFIFNFDTPPVLLQNQQHDKLMIFMSKIYEPEVV